MPKTSWTARAVLGCLALVSAEAVATAAPVTETLAIRGRAQTLRVYAGATPDAPVAIVASGDGGFIHLAPDVAEFLAARGYCVLGFDSKAYLSSFTEGARTLTTDDVPGDFAVLLARALRSSRGPALLVGISEGAALAVLAASDDQHKARLAGVVGLGLPDQAELGWRLRDSVIYITKGLPREPLFSSSDFAARLAPVPLAAIQSTHDEFIARGETDRVMARASEPKRLWMIDAANHNFGERTDELHSRLLEAIAWVHSVRP